MKRQNLIILGVMLCLVITLSGCSAKTPEDVAKDYLSGSIELDIEKMDDNSVVPYETIFMARMNSRIQQGDMTEGEIWEIYAQLYEFEKVPKNFNEYKKYYIKYVEKEMKEQYGDDFAVKTSVITSTELSEEEIATMLSDASDLYDEYDIIISDIIDFTDIKECKKVTCKVYLSGEKVEEDNSVDEGSVYVIKRDGKWKVLNLGLGA